MHKELCSALFRIVSNEKKRLEDERELTKASLASTPPGTALFNQDSCRIQTLNSELVDCSLILHEIGTPAFYAPRLPDDTANRIRKALGLYIDTLRKAAASVGELLQFLPDDKKLIQARFDAFRLIEQARQDLNEFNEAYPEKEE
nr:MAG TPA: hypothetical protein [Caudoviricetes sp.]